MPRANKPRNRFRASFATRFDACISVLRNDVSASCEASIALHGTGAFALPSVGRHERTRATMSLRPASPLHAAATPIRELPSLKSCTASVDDAVEVTTHCNELSTATVLVTAEAVVAIAETFGALAGARDELGAAPSEATPEPPNREMNGFQRPSMAENSSLSKSDDSATLSGLGFRRSRLISTGTSRTNCINFALRSTRSREACNDSRSFGVCSSA